MRHNVPLWLVTAILKDQAIPYGSRWTSLSTLFVLTLLGAQSVFADQPPFELQLKRPGDSATIKAEADRVVVAVTSHSGIGRMTLTSKEGRWPKNVTLRLRYQNGQPFRTLEGFETTSSRMEVRSSSKSD